MGEEKRKRERAVSEADKALKSPRLSVAGKSLNVQAAADSPSDSSEPSEEMTSSSSGNDSAGDSGRCCHMRLDSESVDMSVHDIENSEERPACQDPSCGITWMRASEDNEGMMKCIHCPYVSCARAAVKEVPEGHACLHAAKDKHHIAQWYDEPNLGYCFKCECFMTLSDNQDQCSEDECAEVDRKVNDERGMVASKKTKDQPGIVASNTKDDCGIGVSNAKVDRGMVDHSSKVDWASVARNARNALVKLRMGPGNDARSHSSEYAIGNGCSIRGMPNHGATCYMNASLQCLLALGKLRTMILSPDARLGNLGRHLKQLFVETGSANNGTHMLDPKMVLVYMQSLYQEEGFKVGKMEDSHEFLLSLRNALDNEVVELNKVHIMQGGDVFPTFGYSIFEGQLIHSLLQKLLTSCS